MEESNQSFEEVMTYIETDAYGVCGRHSFFRLFQRTGLHGVRVLNDKVTQTTRTIDKLRCARKLIGGEYVYL